MHICEVAGFDYADQRFYASTYGRFNTVDPAGRRSAKLRDPGSLNRYAYTRGDPVNRRDKSGLDDDGGDDGCVELDDGTYDCGTVITDDTWSWGDPLGGLFDDPAADVVACTGEMDSCPQSDQVAAGGGFAGTPNFAKVQQELLGVVKNAVSALNNPKCAKIFGVGVVDGTVIWPQQVLWDLFQGWNSPQGGNFGSITPGVLYTTVPGGTVSARTYDLGNAGSGGYYGQVQIVLNAMTGVFVNGSLQAQTIVLLHELGHAMDYIFGADTNGFNQNDSGNPNASGSNNNLVKANCF